MSNENYSFSNEGIGNTIKKLFGLADKSDGDIKITKTEKNYYIEGDRFVNDVTNRLDSVSSTSALFVKNGRYNENWLKDLEQDVKRYRSQINKAVTYDRKIVSWENKYAKELDSFIGNADNLSDFTKVVERYVNDQPKPWGELCNDNHDYVIFGRDNWLDADGDFSKPQIKQASKVTVPVQNSPQVDRIKILIENLFELQTELLEIEFDNEIESHGYDFTDAPFRGYMGDSKLDNLVNKLTIHAMVNNDPIDYFEVIHDRIKILYVELIDYATKAK